MKLGAASALHAVIGPQRLRSVARRDFFERMLVCMCAGKRLVVGRVPILGEDNVIESGSDLKDNGKDLVTARNGQGSGGAEVVLHVNDEENVMGSEIDQNSSVPYRSW